MATLSTTGRNAACDAIVDLLDGGNIKIKDGATTLVTFTLATPAFGAATVGVASLSASITGATVTGGGGNPDVHTVSSTATQIFSGTAGTAGELVTSATLDTTDTVSLTAYTVTVPAS